MNSSDIDKFNSLINSVAVIYTAKVSEQLLEIWWHILEQYDFEKVNNAFKSHLSNTSEGRFFPKPADIIKNLNGDSGVRSIVAWEQIFGALRRGKIHELDFEDPAAKRALASIGKDKLKMCSDSDLPWIEKRFREYYDAFSHHSANEVISITNQTKQIGAEK